MVTLLVFALFIVVCGHATNGECFQGRGIEVFSDLAKLKYHIGQSRTGVHEWVLQKYLERPLLLWKRKFDIRIWALVDDSLNIWV